MLSLQVLWNVLWAAEYKYLKKKNLNYNPVWSKIHMYNSRKLKRLKEDNTLLKESF